MNPRLIKFTLELQSEEVPEQKPKYISLNKGNGKKFFNFLKEAFVTVPVDKQ